MLYDLNMFNIALCAIVHDFIYDPIFKRRDMVLCQFLTVFVLVSLSAMI